MPWDEQRCAIAWDDFGLSEPGPFGPGNAPGDNDIPGLGAGQHGRRRRSCGNITVTGGSGPGISVTQQVDYSRTPPTTTRTVSGNTLTVTYSCPTQVVCGVAYTLQVPRSVAVQVSVGAGSIRLAGLAGNMTAKADVGLISATGLTGALASLTTNMGAISASFATAPTTVQASARVGAITLRVPGTASYQVSADAHVGKATVSIPQSASSAHAITASTDVGAIDIAPSS